MSGASLQAQFSGSHVPDYNHTQWSPMNWLLLAPAGILLVTALVVESAVALGMTLLALLFTLLAYSFRSLRVVDEGTVIALRYGPLPIFHKRFAYTDITAAERDRSSIVDGWGMHWVPGRGWTYNLWGFDCVRLTLKGDRTVRIGTDDPSGLERFLQNRIQ